MHRITLVTNLLYIIQFQLLQGDWILKHTYRRKRVPNL